MLKPHVEIQDQSGGSVGQATFHEFLTGGVDATLRNTTYKLSKEGGMLKVNKGLSFVDSRGEKLTWKSQHQTLSCTDTHGNIVATVTKPGKTRTIEICGPFGEELLFSAVIMVARQKRETNKNLLELGGVVGGEAGFAAGGGYS